jgi:hypothetical protein
VERRRQRQLKIKVRRIMIMKKHKHWLVLLILITGLISGCSLIDGQLDEANKLLNESNAATPKFNELITKSNDLFNDLMGEKWVNAQDAQAYKEQNKSKFDELISLREQVEKIGDEQTGKLEKASNLNISKQFKEYLNLLIQIDKKKKEQRSLMIPYIKTFLQTKDDAEINKLGEVRKKKEDVLAKESDELEKKLEQFKKDNPNFLESAK